MKLSELMQGRTLNPSFEGDIMADDMVLALNLNDSEDVGDYIVAQPRISEHSGALNAQTADRQYIRTGNTTIRTGVGRTITVNGDRFKGDPFQDGILDHKIKFGVGSDVIKDYVYFAIQNGKGEKGKVTINVTSDASGTAGSQTSFSATLTSVGVPEDYTYTAGTQTPTP